MPLTQSTSSLWVRSRASEIIILIQSSLKAQLLQAEPLLPFLRKKRRPLQPHSPYLPRRPWKNTAPPSPKLDDAYPGYYQLPSGSWAAHDPAYYKTYSDRWAREYEAQIRAFEKTQRGFEGAGAGGEDAQQVSAAELQDAARAAREEKKGLTTGARLEGERPLPKVSLNASKTGKVARSRHQLHSLLADAYMNREVLEEQIAQGKRNRKEAGNKYGTLLSS